MKTKIEIEAKLGIIQDTIRGNEEEMADISGTSMDDDIQRDHLLDQLLMLDGWRDALEWVIVTQS